MLTNSEDNKDEYFIQKLSHLLNFPGDTKDK